MTPSLWGCVLASGCLQHTKTWRVWVLTVFQSHGAARAGAQLDGEQGAQTLSRGSADREAPSP